jgi:hypothetical protein
MKAQHEDRLTPDNAAVDRAWVSSMITVKGFKTHSCERLLKLM